MTVDYKKAAAYNLSRAITKLEKVVELNKSAKHYIRAYGMDEQLARAVAFALEHPQPCPICKRKKFLCVDHDHVTGKVRGLICQTCNITLGYVADDVNTLHNMIDYLEKSRGDG